VQLFENKPKKKTNLATPSRKACYPQAYVLLNEANNFKICSSSGGFRGLCTRCEGIILPGRSSENICSSNGGASEKEDKVTLSLPQKLMVFGVSSTCALPLLLMYIFAGFFFFGISLCLCALFSSHYR